MVPPSHAIVEGVWVRFCMVYKAITRPDRGIILDCSSGRRLIENWSLP